MIHSYNYSYGKSVKQALLIRLMIDERGLPHQNFILARAEHMVSWDSETGEVKTIEYGQGNQITYMWLDEVG